MLSSDRSASPGAVLIPGLDGTGLLFDTFCSHLPSHWPTKTLAYPRSQVCSVSQLSEFVNTNRPADSPHFLIAESFGGPVALKAVAKRAKANRNESPQVETSPAETSPAETSSAETNLPDQLLGLILVATFVSSPIPTWLRPVLRITAGTIARLPLPRSIVSYFMMEGYPELFPLFRQRIESLAPLVLRQRLRDVACINARIELARCPVPILYIQAQHDRLVGLHHLEEILQLKPDLEVASIDAPHLVLQSCPQRAAEIIVDFMQRHSSDKENI